MEIGTVMIMKLKIAIIDDEKIEREYIKRIVAPWAEKNPVSIEVRCYSGASEFFFDYDAEKDFDILLLDVEMPGVNGIETAKTVRRTSSVVQIVFITGYMEYFSDGYDVSALHYLLKPVSPEKLYSVLDRAFLSISRNIRSVLVSTPEEDIKVPMTEILYLEADNVYVAVHTEGKVYRTRSSLFAFSEHLDETFLKVHRSFIVSLKQISSISRFSLTMKNGDVVPMSRGSYNAVKTALVKYL